MKLHEQRDRLAQALRLIEDEATMLLANIERKTSQPYGDGTYSNQVNAATDVCPAVMSIRSAIRDALDDIG